MRVFGQQKDPEGIEEVEPDRGIGDNEPPLAERLALEHEDLVDSTAAIAALATAAPKEVTNDDELAQVAALGKQARDLRQTAEGTRVTVSSPHYNAWKTVNGFFGVHIDRLQKILDAMEQRAGKYQAKKAAEARAIREAEARRLQEEEDARRRAAAEETRKLQEEEEHQRQVAAAEAERGRKVSAAKREEEANRIAAEAAARQRESQEQARQQEGKIAAVTHEGETAAKDAGRVRADDGTLATTTTKWTVAIEDWDALDLNALKAHFSRGDVEKAARAFVKVHRDTKPVKGLRIFPDTKATFR